MKITKRVLAITLIVISVVAMMSACSVKNGNSNNTGSNGGPKGFVYVPEYIPVPSEITNMQSVSYFGEKVYFTSNVPVEPEKPDEMESSGDVDIMPVGPGFYFGETETKLFRMNMDGTGLEQLPGYVAIPIPEGSMGSIDIIGMCIDDQGYIWIAEQGYFYHFEENGNYVDDGRKIEVRKLDETGAEVGKLDLSSLLAQNQYFYINGMSMDKDGNIYISDGSQAIYVYDSQGNKKYEMALDGWVNNIVRMGDGTVAVTTYESAGNVLKPIDASTGSWKDSIPLPLNAWNAYPGAGEYLVFFSDGNNLYGYKEGAAESEKLLSWINCDIDGNSISSMTILPDGRVACITVSYNYVNYSQKLEMALLTRVDASTLPQKTHLSLATFYMDYNLRAKVIEFNKKSAQYRIEVTDYSEYNTQEDYTAGIMKLNTEIISGNVPDILCTSRQIPVDQYISKGLLEDLYPYIDKDPDLGRDAIVQEVFRALEKEGKLYQIASSFGIFTVVGDKNRIGGEPGWTLDELNNVLSQMPEGTIPFAPYYTRDTMLETVLSMNMNEYVDWISGKCNYNSEDFVKLLEFVNGFPKEYDWMSAGYVDENELIQSGQQLLRLSYLYNFNDFQMYNAILGGNLVFKGFPCDSRNGNALIVDSGIAMSTKCRDKEGAWQFIRILLTEEYQNEGWFWGFPTNKKVFDEMVKEAMTPNTYTDENGNTVEEPKMEWYVNNAPVVVYSMTDEEYNMFMDLLDRTDRLMTYDNSIMNIIREEAAVYFEGQKTAQECADVIQSRVEIYVNEQK